MTYQEIKYFFELIQLNRTLMFAGLAPVDTYIHMHIFISLISKKVIFQCVVCGGVIYISNKSKLSQDWNELDTREL